MTPATQSFPQSAVRILNPLLIPDWNEQMLRLRAGFFHSVEWAEVLHRSYRFSPCYLALPTEGQIDAVLPLMDIRSWLTGRRGVSLPFTDAVEPICESQEQFLQLWAAAQAIGRERGWKYLECRGGKRWQPDAPASTSFHAHVLSLESPESELFGRLDDSVRRAVRKAERGKLELEFSYSLDAMRAFYELLGRTRRRHGVPPQPFGFFAEIQSRILEKKCGVVVLCRHEGQPVAGAVYFHFGNQVIYKFGASDERSQQLRANNLVMWRAIQHYQARGFKSFDFGRTSLQNAGLRKFKLGWGTTESRIECTRYSFRTNSFVEIKDEAQGWHNRIFSAMPPALARISGELLYPHIG